MKSKIGNQSNRYTNKVVTEAHDAQSAWYVYHRINDVWRIELATRRIDNA